MNSVHPTYPISQLNGRQYQSNVQYSDFDQDSLQTSSSSSGLDAAMSALAFLAFGVWLVNLILPNLTFGANAVDSRDAGRSAQVQHLNYSNDVVETLLQDHQSIPVSLNNLLSTPSPTITSTFDPTFSDTSDTTNLNHPTALNKYEIQNNKAAMSIWSRAYDAGMILFYKISLFFQNFINSMFPQFPVNRTKQMMHTRKSPPK